VSWRRWIVGVFNSWLEPFQARIVHAADIDWTRCRRTFTYDGHDFPYFYHTYNCGWPPAPTTERALELAIADYWLSNAGPRDVVELGAVTPYYWPHRIADIIDQTDTHPLVSLRVSLFEVDISARPVLSISTIEHIGKGDYGLAREPILCLRALNKLFSDSPRFLLTVPFGYNCALDNYLLSSDLPSDVRLDCLVRCRNLVDWAAEANPRKAWRPYEVSNMSQVARPRRRGADALAILRRD
jgi:hypothetical protein